MKSGAIFLVSRTLAGIVFVMEQASDVGQGALLRWHPQVRRSGIEHNLEALWRSSYADSAKVLRI